MLVPIVLIDMNEWSAVRRGGVRTLCFFLGVPRLVPAAFADWTQTGRAESHVICVDKATLRQVGRQSWMQMLRDYVEAQLAAPRHVLRSSCWVIGCGTPNVST